MQKNLRNSFISLSALLAAPFVHAQTLTWEVNGTGTGQSNGGGNWLGTGQWWNGTTHQELASDSDAVFGEPNTNGGTVGLTAETSAQSLTFNTVTSTYTMGSSGTVLTSNQWLTMNAASGIVALTASSIKLGGPQPWTNNSTSALNARSGVDTNTHTLMARPTALTRR